MFFTGLELKFVRRFNNTLYYRDFVDSTTSLKNTQINILIRKVTFSRSYIPESDKYLEFNFEINEFPELSRHYHARVIH